jgi:ubiquitin C-terminal hydrolase
MKSVDLLLSAESKGTNRRRLEFIKPLKSVNNFRCGSNGSNHERKSRTFKSDSREHAGAIVVDKEKQGIFALSQVEANMRWSKISRAGPGFFNQGNTCFLNSTLQCLLHIPALVQILQKHSAEALKGLISKQHQGPQKSIAEYFTQLVVETGSSGGKSLSPRSMVQNIRRVGRQFRPGRQVNSRLSFMWMSLIFLNTGRCP